MKSIFILPRLTPIQVRLTVNRFAMRSHENRSVIREGFEVQSVFRILLHPWGGGGKVGSGDRDVR